MRLELYTVCGCRQVVQGTPIGYEFRVPISAERPTDDPIYPGFSYRAFEFEAEYTHPLDGRTWVMRERYEP